MIFVKINRADGSIMRQKKADEMYRVFNKSTVWLELVRTSPPPHDEETQKLVKTLSQPDMSDLDVDVDPSTKRIEGWEVVALTGQEIIDRQIEADQQYIRNEARDKAMWVLVELISKLLADGVITAGDFKPVTRQAFLDLKERVDRTSV